MFTDNLIEKKVLVIDNDPEFTKLASITFNNTGAQVLVTPNCLDAMSNLFAYRPDLVILGDFSPDNEGFKICQRIRQYVTTPLIMVSALDQNQNESMLKGFEAGADDFLSKPISSEILLARAKAVLRRSEINSGIQDRFTYNDGHLKVDMEKRRVLVRGRQVKFTPVEFRMLAYLMVNAGKVISYEDILIGVWSGSQKIRYGKVHVYISHLRNKIEENPKKPTYIRSVHSVGYIFEKQVQAEAV